MYRPEATQQYTQTTRMTGADMVMQALKDQNADTIFGYPGGAALPLYDALAQQDYVRHILTRHEQGAIHAAQGFARASGKTGVVMATSGPGATNLVTGLADAYADSTPIVAITGQVASTLIGTNAFQECDITGVTRSITKHNYLIERIEDLPRILHEAFAIAQSGRPGPVLIDIPKDIQFQMGEYRFHETHEFEPHRMKQPPAPRRDDIDHAARMMMQAKRPIFYTGGGVINAGDKAVELLHRLVLRTGFPITSTLMGLGAFPASHPQWLGMLGMHGTYEANNAMHDADLIIAAGVRFDDRVTGRTDAFAPRAKIIHIDADASEIGKIIHADLKIISDCTAALGELDAEMAGRKTQNMAGWWEQIDKWRARQSLSYEKTPGKIMQQDVIKTLFHLARQEFAGRKVILTTDVGQHQMFAAQHFGFDAPRSFITSGGLGTMGFGLPAAIGAQIAQPDALVICVTGDGSFQMNLQEMNTAWCENLPVKVVLMNNESMGMVDQWQKMLHGERYSQSQLPRKTQPDFRQVAKGMRWKAQHVKDPRGLKGSLSQMMRSDQPFLLDISVVKGPCLPMIQGGKAHNEMILPPMPV